MATELLSINEILPRDTLSLIIANIHHPFRIHVFCVCRLWNEIAIRTYLEDYVVVGVRKFKQGKNQEAMEILQKVLHIHDKHGLDWRPRKKVYVLNFLGNALQRLKKTEEAIAAQEHALSLEPTNLVALNNKGDNLNTMGRYEDALYYFDQVLKANPRHLSSLYNKGRSLLYLCRFDEAREFFNRALQDFPQDVDTLCELATAELHLGNLERVIELCDNVLSQTADPVARHLRRLASRQMDEPQHPCPCGRFKICQPMKNPLLSDPSAQRHAPLYSLPATSGNPSSSSQNPSSRRRNAKPKIDRRT